LGASVRRGQRIISFITCSTTTADKFEELNAGNKKLMPQFHLQGLQVHLVLLMKIN
jgi:hypothetical protein